MRRQIIALHVRAAACSTGDVIGNPIVAMNASATDMTVAIRGRSDLCSKLLPKRLATLSFRFVGTPDFTAAIIQLPEKFP